MIKAFKSFVLDAAGNLIELHASRFPNALIPNAVRVASSSDDLAHPFPWTLTPKSAVDHLCSLPETLVVGTIAETVYQRKQVPNSPFPFVPPATVHADDVEVMALLDVYDTLANEEDRCLIESELSTVGIIKMPVLTYAHPETHICTGVQRLVGHSKAGWISHTKVYRKAVPVFTSTAF